MLPKHRRIARGGLGGTMPFLLFFVLQFGGIFSQIVGDFCAINELTERLDGHNDPFAQFDGSDLPCFDQIHYERLANVKQFCRLRNGHADLGDVFRRLVVGLFRRSPCRKSEVECRYCFLHNGLNVQFQIVG